MMKQKQKNDNFPSVFTLSIVAVLALGLLIALVHRVHSLRVFELQQQIIQNTVDSKNQADYVTHLLNRFADLPSRQPTLAEVIRDINTIRASLDTHIQQSNVDVSTEDRVRLRSAFIELTFISEKLQTQNNELKVPADVSPQTTSEITHTLLNFLEIFRRSQETELKSLIDQSHTIFEKDNRYVMALVMIIIIITSMVLFFNKAWHSFRLTGKNKRKLMRQRQEQDYRAIIDTQQNGVLVVAGGKVVFANQALRSLLQLSVDDVDIENAMSFSKNNAEEFNEHIQQCLRTGELVAAEMQLMLKDNQSALLVKLNLSPISWQGTRAVCLTFLKGDEAQSCFSQLTQKNLLLDQIHSAMVTADFRGKITCWNKGAEKLFGYSKDEVIGKNFSILYPENEQAFLQNKLILPLHEYRNIEQEIQLKHKKCNLFYAHMSLSLMHDSDGKPFGFVSVIVDVNERLKRETSLLAEKQGLDDIIKQKTVELRESLINLESENKRRIITQASLIKAKNEAEKANIKKSEFLSRISHELRTPLNAILGFSQLLEYEEMAKDQKGMISEISTAGRHLISLINEILELSRIESGNAHVVIEDIAIKDVIRDCAAIIKMQPRAETIRFEDKTEQHENYVLRADKTKIKEVLLNLLTNAVKYNRKNGKVTIDYRITESNMLRLSVVDTGEGINSSKLKDLFEPFNRLGAEHTDIEGTGIGLTITKELMELMHGNIGVNSEEGVGTEFWIDCQLSSSDSQAMTQTEKTPARFSTEKHTILSIEDNLANQRLIEQVIKRNTQFNIESTFNAEEGIKKAIQLQPSLVLMDIHLPDMDGYAAIKQFQQHSQLKNIPVIAISATTTEGSLEKGQRAGFKDYITKPINTDELICKIMDVLEVSERKVS